MRLILLLNHFTFISFNRILHLKPTLMKKVLLLTFLLALITTSGFSQTDKFWSANNESRSNILTDKAVARLAYPKAFKLFNLNTESLKRELFSVVGNNVTKHSTVITLPNADGNLEAFEVFEASNFESDLQAQFPDIRAYSGRGITDKYASLKLSISHKAYKPWFSGQKSRLNL